MVRLVPQENENQKIETSLTFQIQLGNLIFGFGSNVLIPSTTLKNYVIPVHDSFYL